MKCNKTSYFVKFNKILFCLIKVGGNLAGKHKNRIGAFHPHSGVILDFNFLKTLPEEHVRNGVAELIKISTVEEKAAFELIEQHCEDLIRYGLD